MPPGMMPQGMMPPGMSPSMMFAMQAKLGPGGMPSGQIPMHPSNPMQGMPGIPSGQMEYLQRQMQTMAMQRPPGMGQQPFPSQQMPGESYSYSCSCSCSCSYSYSYMDGSTQVVLSCCIASMLLFALPSRVQYQPGTSAA